VRFFELVPRSCGHKHAHYSAIYRCITRNGVPGFELVEHRVPDARAQEVPVRA
jgi:hypothetical protein